MNLKQVCHCKHSSIFYHFRIISRWRTAWLWNRGHWKWHHSIDLIRVLHDHILYRFRDYARYWSKIAIFQTPYGRPYRNFAIIFRTHKIVYSNWLQEGEKVCGYVYRFWLYERDRRTDGRTDTALCRPSHGNKRQKITETYVSTKLADVSNWRCWCKTADVRSSLDPMQRRCNVLFYWRLSRQ